MIRSSNIRQAFNAASKNYDAFALLQRTIADRLIESFDYLKIKPNVILDLGSGTGYGARALKKRFKKASFYQCDLSDAMLKYSREKSPSFFSREHFFCADAQKIPLPDSFTDVVFSNLMLQWCADLNAIFTEIKRVLTANGVFLFSSLGPDTLNELRSSWGKVDGYIHTNTFVDMRDMGDALMHNGLSSPVLSVEHMVLNYDDCRQLMQDIKGVGAKNMNVGRRSTLTGKGKLQLMMKNYETFRCNKKLPATYEVIYGHAWHNGEYAADLHRNQSQTISLKQLRQVLKNRH